MEGQLLVRATLVLAFCSVLAYPACAQDKWVAGVLLTPFPDSNSHYIGGAGDTIHYRDAANGKSGFDIQFMGRTVRNVWEVRLAPRFDWFLAAYIYHLLETPDELLSDDPGELLSRRLQLAIAAQRLLPYHKYREDFVAFECRALQAKEDENDGKGGYGAAVSCLDRYLHDFPHGRAHDELEWLRCQLASSVYEFEGDVGLVLGQANAFRLFLRLHPRTHVRSDVEFAVARLYTIAAEILRLEPPESGSLTKNDAPKYRALAERMYRALVLHHLPSVSAHAQVALFNLLEGRRIYANPNEY
jgi:hypothetical protein